MNTKSIHINSSFDALGHTFSVYSNELANAIYVDLHTEDSNAFYVVYNKKGQIVKKNHNLLRRNTISLHPFPSGYYTIEINYRKKTVIKNILKL